MNPERKILIHCLDIGFMITDFINDKEYAKETGIGVIDILNEILNNKKIENIQDEIKVDNIKDTNVKDDLSVISNGILIPKVKFDKSLKNKIMGYKNAWYIELDGKVIVGYNDVSYCTTKEKVMQIQYPVPYGYFKKYNLSNTAVMCLRAYRHHLSINNQQPIQKTSQSEKLDIHNVNDCINCKNKDTDNCNFCTSNSRFEKNKMSEKTKILREMTIKMGIT